MANSKAICSWAWIVVGLLIMMLSYIVLAYGGKIFVGCDGSFTVYLAETDPDADQLNFHPIITLNNVPTGITHDPKTGHIYITESSTRILRANQDGSGVETVINLPGSERNLRGIYLMNEQIFWSDFDADTINSASVNGSGSKVIISNAFNGRGITGDDSVIYWAANSNATVKKAGIDGNGVTTVISELTKIYAVTIDSSERILYAGNAERRRASIIRYNLDTNDQVVLFNDGRYIEGITILGDLLFFFEVSIGIKAIRKNGSSPLPLSYTGLENCTKFKSIHAINGLQPNNTKPIAVTIHPYPTGVTETYSSPPPDIRKLACYLNRETVPEFNNEFRWVLDIDKRQVCHCTSVSIGKIYRKPVTRSFQPFHVRCPMDVLFKDEETLAKVFQC
ncbi:uncharacterized protein [Amphiura filiformis]|uniref:uncharacterized protein n=1 Tax=Amphiura filiformis TaxID=82378 RepID=UPI003B2287A9